MKKLIILAVLLLSGCVSSGCAAGISVGPPENPYGDAHVEITKRST